MYLFFDTETTGLPKDYKAPISELDNWPRLVQIAWLKYTDSGEKLLEKNYVIKPQGFIIPERASKIHGITNEMAMNEGVELKSVLIEFSEILNKSKTLVAHNISFDEKIIGAEFLRNDIQSNLLEIQKICTMKASMDFCKIPCRYRRYKWPNLSELHSILFNKPLLNGHDAMIDTTACAKCFFELKSRGVID
ncbi:MAG: 3'-5' exonuclease [Candidatus Aenigmatarchaeota archaeon]|nr:MAG: 3'-5' exonuclease [Candidatus Aenigmarchaeota archaeon]